MGIQTLTGIAAALLLIIWSMHALSENEWLWDSRLYTTYMVTASVIAVYAEFLALVLLALWGLGAL